jgi:WD40 repeat protein
LRGHTKGVNAVAISSDGSLIVSAGSDGTLKLWNKENGQERFSLRLEGVNAVAFSPDGTKIITASFDKMVKVWEASSGQELHTIPLNSPIFHLDLHHSEPVIACGDVAGGVYILELIGISYGPIIVTAVNRERKLEVRCPACQKDHVIKEEQLGGELTCPTPGCGLRLKINPFTIEMK